MPKNTPATTSTDEFEQRLSLGVFPDANVAGWVSIWRGYIDAQIIRVGVLLELVHLVGGVEKIYEWLKVPLAPV